MSDTDPRASFGKRSSPRAATRMARGERLIIRSYRRVFEVDRRIYRVDRWALPVPGGVPLRGVSYSAAALGLVLALGRVPGLAELLGAVSAPLRFVVGPMAVAVLATQATTDGRAAHRFVRSWLGVRWRSGRRSARTPGGADTSAG